MGLVLLAQEAVRPILLLVLVPTLALAYWEVREQQLRPPVARWWMLVVALAHVPGYLALRVWSHRRAEPAD